MLADEPQLLAQPLLDASGDLAVDQRVALTRRLAAHGLEILVGGGAVGRLVVRKPVVQVRRDIERAALGDPRALLERFRPLLEELLHLGG